MKTRMKTESEYENKKWGWQMSLTNEVDKWEWQMRMRDEKWEIRIKLWINKKKMFLMSCQINV